MDLTLLARGFVLGFTIATAVTDLLVDWRRVLGIVGGLFLLFLAWRTFRVVPGEAAANGARRRGGLGGAYVSTLGLTLTNPMTILSFAALFVGLGVIGADAVGAGLLTAGVFLGSGAWWVVLVGVVGALRSRVTPAVLRRVNVASGLLIGAFALVALGSAAVG